MLKKTRAKRSLVPSAVSVAKANAAAKVSAVVDLVRFPRKFSRNSIRMATGNWTKTSARQHNVPAVLSSLRNMTRMETAS